MCIVEQRAALGRLPGSDPKPNLSDGAGIWGCVVKANQKRSRSRRRSNKGALIKGMSTRLPIELLGDLSFKDGLQQIMRGYAGVYALYRGSDLYYVGLANNLYDRLRAHTKNKHRRKWDRFAIFRVGRVRYLKDMETLLLQVAKPPGNSLGGHLHRDADLNRVLRQVTHENTMRLKRIKKALR